MFKKGHKHSENWYKKQVGNTWGFQKGHVYSHWTNKKMSLETRKKMSLAHKGKIAVVKHTPEAINKIKEARKRQVGEKCPAWKGGITPIHSQIRNSLEMANWRKTIFERDDYRCISCGERGGLYLHADHIFPFSQFPRLRFDINNGRTLCRNCHRKTETYGRGAGKFSIEGKPAIFITA